MSRGTRVLPGGSRWLERGIRVSRCVWQYRTLTSFAVAGLTTCGFGYCRDLIGRGVVQRRRRRHSLPPSCHELLRTRRAQPKRCRVAPPIRRAAPPWSCAAVIASSRLPAGYWLPVLRPSLGARREDTAATSSPDPARRVAVFRGGANRPPADSATTNPRDKSSVIDLMLIVRLHAKKRRVERTANRRWEAGRRHDHGFI